MEDFLQTLAPFVASFVETLIRDGKFGVTVGTARFSDAWTGCGIQKPGKRCADRFKLHLPYADQTLTWETLFNCNYPDEPPDFIFPADDQQFQPDIADLQTLCNWNPDDNNSLLKVVQELLHEYKTHQLSLLSGSRLEYDYNSLIDDPAFECKPDDIEVFVSRKNGFSYIGPVQFVIKLKVDLSNLPDFLRKHNPADGVALLHVSYQSLDGGRVQHRLQLSTRLEQLFYSCDVRLNIQPFPPEGCLVDYVLTVRQYLQKLVDSITLSYEKRKEFVSAFLAHFGSSVVELSEPDNLRISFLFVWNDFSFLVIICLSHKFPAEQPQLVLQSIYHARPDSTRYCKTYTGYPYSPRWSGAEMAQRTRTFILDTIQEFQKSSVYEGSSLSN